MVKQAATIVKYIKVDDIQTKYMARSDKKVISPSGNALTLSPDGYYTLIVDGKKRRIKETSIEFPVVKKPKSKKKAEVKAPKSMTHTNTKNISFLRVHETLKQAGVKNNKFMLTLSNPELEGVNPRNAALKRETREAIIAEIIENPWYYLREVVRIELTQEIASAVHMVLLKSDVYVVTHELYASKLYEAFAHLNAWFMFATTSSEAKVIGDSQVVSSNFINTVYSGTNIKWLDKLLFKPSHLSMNRIVLENTNSSIVMSPSPVNATSASNIGRGSTSNITTFLNFEYMHSAIYLLQEMLPAFKTTRKKRQGDSVCISRIILTTASKNEQIVKPLNDYIIPNAVSWNDSMYDMTSDEIAALLSNGEDEIPKLVYFEQDTAGEPSRFKPVGTETSNISYTIRPRSESKLQWYNEPKLVEAACNLYDTNEFGKYPYGVPESVLEDIKNDGHDIPVESYNEQAVQNLICDYTIRNICQTLAENYPIKNTDIGSSLEETLFNTFGTNSLVATNKLLTTNIIAMGRYHNLLMEFMKTCADITLVNSVGAGGLYNVEHIHAMMKTVFSE